MRPLSAALLACAACAAVVLADDFKPEPGFKPLLNGKDLSGWQTKADTKKDKDAKPLPLDGKADAYDKRFVVKDGELVIDPKVKGDRYIESVQQFGGDFAIRFDFKPGDGCNNDVLLLGTKFDLNSGGKDGKGLTKGLKPNEWNKLEINAKGGSIDFVVNGEKAATQKAKGDKGPLTLRAEFGPIVIKNLRASESK